jgi:sulfatase maturation enzyme AslB (radical SAM superfamily)
MSRPFDKKARDIFKVIEITTINKCNRNCRTCPNYRIEKNGELMEEKVYFKIMDDLKRASFSGRISPYDMNEPTLDPRLPDWIARTRAMFPNNQITIGSNGMLIDQNYVRMLLARGLSQILITCYDEFVYEKFKTMVDNKTVRIWPVFKENLEKIFMNRGGNIDVGVDCAVQRPCEKGLQQAMINYLGDMVLCCSDYYYTTVAGNVMDADVIDLYNCEKFKKIRELLAKGDRASIPLCSKCNFLRTESDIAKAKL